MVLYSPLILHCITVLCLVISYYKDRHTHTHTHTVSLKTKMCHNFVHIHFLIILQDKQLYAYTCNTLQKGTSSRRNVSLDGSRASSSVCDSKTKGTKGKQTFQIGCKYSERVWRLNQVPGCNIIWYINPKIVFHNLSDWSWFIQQEHLRVASAIKAVNCLLFPLMSIFKWFCVIVQ